MPINPVIFQIPSALATLRDEIKALPGYGVKFDEDDNLILFLSPTEYKRVTEGEPSKLVTGYSSSFTMHSTRRVGFEFTTAEGRDRIVQLLRQLAIWSRQTRQTVTVRDYHVLEDQDAYELGYTVRHGQITAIEEQGGSVRQDDAIASQRFTKGFRLQFWEKELREYF